MIARIAIMRKFEKAFRLQADSCEEIAAEFSEVAAKLGRRIKFDRYKLRPGPLLNALVLEFLLLSEEQREIRADVVMARLEAFMRGDDVETPVQPSGPGRVLAIRDESEHQSKLDRQKRSAVKSKRNHKGTEGQGSPVPTR